MAMVAKLSTYNGLPPQRSHLLKTKPDAVPLTDDLESLTAELKLVRQLSVDRAKKAGEDLRTIEESMRRMKEKEKGKQKALEKIKRERDFTPLPEAEIPVAAKPRYPSLPGNGLPSAEDLKKKKKRKREGEEHDLEPDAQRVRKTTPVVVSHAATPVPRPPKIAVSVSKSGGQDFSTPPENQLLVSHLLPPRPPAQPAPVPGPSKPTDVEEDFSKLKQPTQTVIATYYTSIEPWMRTVREEDVGFLEYTGDEVEPYIMPRLGRHYQEIWDDADKGIYPPQEAPPPNFSAPNPKWDPSSLVDAELTSEDKGHGPLTERVISALLPMKDHGHTWKGVKAAEDAMEGRPGGSGSAAAKKEKMNVEDLEIRIRDTMRWHGILADIPDFTDKVDDPISAALRQAQSELRTVVATNKARKARLIAIARDRLGYQEYLDLRDNLDKNISNTYAKLQKKDGPKIAKKKKKSDLETDSTPAPAPPCPAALGLGPDDDNRLVVSEQLRNLVATRRKWVDNVGGVLEKRQEQNPGRMWGLPTKSIYEGLDEDIRLLLAPSDPGEPANKGKAKEQSMDMDIG
ncbi:histone acetyltransferases subunit 3-domain-containing protein [Mycena floridula]|nr:histone acetyltransferases subunit 3-domain-containing protein [Mycena floridula]